GLETFRQGGDERRQYAVDGLLGSRFLHAAAKPFDVDRRRHGARLRRPGTAVALHRREQVVRLEWLREIAAQAARQAPLALAAQRVGGEGDDRERRTLRQRAD